MLRVPQAQQVLVLLWQLQQVLRRWQRPLPGAVTLLPTCVTARAVRSSEALARVLANFCACAAANRAAFL